MKKKLTSLFLAALEILSLTGCSLSETSQTEIIDYLKNEHVIESTWDYIDYYDNTKDGTINFIYADALNAYNVVSVPNVEADTYDVTVNKNVVLEYKDESYIGFEEPETTVDYKLTIEDGDLNLEKVD